MSKRRSSGVSRLRQDYIRLKADPVPFILAEPLPTNMLEWHYAVRGPPDSPYAGGCYHGKLVFPPQFPFKPPAIYMSTPSGRFKTDTRLCLSMSDFHPDTWNPAWSVSTILTGLLSFMLEAEATQGSVETTDAEKRQLALSSHEYNLRSKVFVELFPELMAEEETGEQGAGAESLAQAEGVEKEMDELVLVDEEGENEDLADGDETSKVKKANPKNKKGGGNKKGRKLL